MEDLDFSRAGSLIVTIRKSKTDQGAAVRGGAATRAWAVRGRGARSLAHIIEKKNGPLFFSFSPHGELRETRIEGRLVAEVVKRLFRDAGASPSEIDAIGGHSLRRGFVTPCAAANSSRSRSPILASSTRGSC
jgi:hypothetical protein